MKVSGLSGAAICGLLIAGAADARDLSVHLDDLSTNASEVYMLGETDGIMRFESHGSIEARDGDASGLAGATADCFGLGRMVAGVIEGDGACSFEDSDGDLFQVGWRMRPGPAPAGEWWALGGTGKWAGSAGGGTWMDEPMGEANAVTHIDGVLMQN
jgi:hypothetical protein